MSPPWRFRILMAVRVIVVRRPESAAVVCSSSNRTTELTFAGYCGTWVEIRSLSQPGVSSAACSATAKNRAATARERLPVYRLLVRISRCLERNGVAVLLLDEVEDLLNVVVSLRGH